jgi:hypothetical protein
MFLEVKVEVEEVGVRFLGGGSSGWVREVVGDY